MDWSSRSIGKGLGRVPAVERTEAALTAFGCAAIGSHSSGSATVCAGPRGSAVAFPFLTWSVE